MHIPFAQQQSSVDGWRAVVRMMAFPTRERRNHVAADAAAALQPFIVCVFVWLPVAAQARQTQHTTRGSRCGGRLVFKVSSQYNAGSASFCWPATKSIRRQQTHRSW